MRAVVILATLCLSLAALPSMSQTKTARVSEVALSCFKSPSTRSEKRTAPPKADCIPAASAVVIVLLEHASEPAAASAVLAAKKADTAGTTDKAAPDPSPVSGKAVTPVAQKPPAAAASAASGAGSSGKSRLWGLLTTASLVPMAFTALLIAAIGVFLVVLSLQRIPQEGLYFKRHWGGFGGASTGWDVSVSLVLLLIGTALAFLSGTIVVCLIASTLPPDEKSSVQVSANAPADKPKPEVRHADPDQ